MKRRHHRRHTRHPINPKTTVNILSIRTNVISRIRVIRTQQANNRTNRTKRTTISIRHHTIIDNTTQFRRILSRMSTTTQTIRLITRSLVNKTNHNTRPTVRTNPRSTIHLNSHKVNRLFKNRNHLRLKSPKGRTTQIRLHTRLIIRPLRNQAQYKGNTHKHPLRTSNGNPHKRIKQRPIKQHLHPSRHPTPIRHRHTKRHTRRHNHLQETTSSPPSHAHTRTYRTTKRLTRNHRVNITHLRLSHTR